METPYIQGFDREQVTDNSFVVIVHAEDCSEATKYAKGYFGDRSLDMRDSNVVEYLDSDFDSNHRYRVTLMKRPARWAGLTAW